jgi:phospholipase C
VALDRRGDGPRTPLLVVSPFSKVNFVDHRVTDQTSFFSRPHTRPVLLAPDGRVLTH